MEVNCEICAICREENGDFETRCGHLFHEKCLQVAIFSSSVDKKCPYCRGPISSNKDLEKVIRTKGDVSGMIVNIESIRQLKDLVKSFLEYEFIRTDLIIEKMMAMGWDVNQRDNWSEHKNSGMDNFNSLFYASCRCGNWGLSSKLIDLGCELDLDGSIFPHAVKMNNVQFLKKLINFGADINSFDCNENALGVACANDNVEMVDFLLENGANIFGYEEYNCAIVTNKYKSDGLDTYFAINITPLITACIHSSFNSIRRLYKHDPNLFKEDSVAWEAFAIAINQANFRLLHLIIELGGNINAVDSEYKINLFMLACSLGKIEIIKFIFEKGRFDINAVDADETGAFLYSFTNSDNTELFKFLIDNGANIFAKTKQTKLTAIHIACLKDSYEVFEYLLNETAFGQIDLNSLSPARHGLIQSVLESRSVNVMKYLEHLLQKGLDINEKNYLGEKAFLHASDCSYEVLSYLLANGADVNSKNWDKSSCFHRLLLGCSRFLIENELLELFIHYGVDLNHQSRSGSTCLHYAFDHYFELFEPDFLELLINAGAKADIQNDKGEYPFDVAFRNSPFNGLIGKLEKLELNYSKDIPNFIKSKPCDFCKCTSSSLKTRCGHYLHFHCLKDNTRCPICGIRITLSNIVEQIIRESDSSKLISLSHKDLFILLNNFIEDENVIEYDSITSELKRRKNLNKKDFKLPSWTYPKMH